MNTHILKKPIGTLPAGTKLKTHYRELWGNVIGIPRDKNNFWGMEFAAKRPDIFEPLNNQSK